MKRKIVLLIAAFIVMGLALVTFGLNSGGSLFSTIASCCCHGDSCPMKKKDSPGKEVKSCCDDCSCCKGEKGAESCPMKNKGAGDANSQTEHKNCGCPCCKKDGDKENPHGAVT